MQTNMNTAYLTDQVIPTLQNQMLRYERDFIVFINPRNKFLHLCNIQGLYQI